MLGSVRTVNLSPESTVADAVRAASVSDDLEVRFRGARLTREQMSETILENGDVVIATPPQVKHGH